MMVRANLRRLVAALAIQWRAAPLASATIAAITLVTGSTAAAGAWLMKALLDELARGAAADAERAVGLVIAGAMITGGTMALVHAAGYLDVRIGRAISLTTERALFSHVGRFVGLAVFEDPAFHDRLRLAEQASREAPQHVAELIQITIQTAIMLSTLTGVVVTVSPGVALAFLACAATTMAAQIARSRHQVRAMHSLTGSFRRRDAFRALLVDTRAAKEIRLYGLQNWLLDRMLRAHNETARVEDAVARATAGWQIALALLSAGVTAAGATVVVHGALSGRYRIGDIALFLAAIAGLQGALSHFVSAVGRAGTVLALFTNYLDILAMPVPPAGGRAPGPLRDAIELDDVWFRYSPDLPWVLRGVTLRIGRGETLGIVGENGAGKSTLVKLLCRLYEPERGSIRWDSTDLASFDPAALRRRIAATFQDFMTYDLTAAQNIGIGELGALEDDARIRAAAARVGLDDTLAALPAGYRTLLSRVLVDDADTPGVVLSGGQWQRIAIARALMREHADLVILDEPSAGLDANAEHQLQRALAGGGTRLLVSHRLGQLRGADRIAVLAGGAVVELGSHDQLMQSGGPYARLFALQARDYQDARVAGALEVA
jgi:ATP-binding cassette subfamily B protein